MRFKYVRFSLLQTVSWLVIFVLPYLNFIFEPQKLATTNIGNIFLPFLFTFFLFSVFYFNLFVLAPSFFPKKTAIYLLILVVILGIFFAYNSLIFELLLTPNLKPRTSDERKWEIFPKYIFPGIMYILCILVSSILFLLNERRQENEARQNMEIEKIATELSMLKLQISPHFLFNTLNNIRWMVRKQMAQTEEVVLKLSEILRYMIYEVGEVKIPINQEIEHLKNYIELQSLRLPVPGTIEFNVSPNIGSQKIEPLLYIHFVENAFKYGIDAKNAPEIFFSLDFSDNKLTFESKNKILGAGNQLENSGIGLSNIKRRLELLYSGKYNLTTQNRNGFFEVNLTIWIDEN
jgi:sensor histidine kinase YesM